MVAIPTLAQEDAKPPNRERESLVGEQSRIVNRMKAALARLDIRGFNPKLKKAVERLDGLRTLAELKHDLERRRRRRRSSRPFWSEGSSSGSRSVVPVRSEA
jgi:transposase